VRKHTLALEPARLDELQEVFYARGLQGDVQCGALITKIIERRCTMLGLYTPQTATLQVIEAEAPRQPTKSVPSSNASGARPGTIRTTRHPPIRHVVGVASVGLWRASQLPIAGDCRLGKRVVGIQNELCGAASTVQKTMFGDYAVKAEKLSVFNICC
jgi:hypothetical protein